MRQIVGFKDKRAIRRGPNIVNAGNTLPPHAEPTLCYCLLLPPHCLKTNVTRRSRCLTRNVTDDRAREHVAPTTWEAYMDTKMTHTTRAERPNAIRRRYRPASGKEKCRILDEFVATTGYHGKSTIRVQLIRKEHGAGW